MSEPTSPDCCACGCVNETRESRKSEWIYWTCGGWQHIDSGKFGVSGIENRGTHMALIRSLREELAAARDEAHAIHVQYVKTLLVKDRIVKQLDKAQSSNAQSELDLLQSIIDRDKARATLKEHELVCYGAMERGRDAERDRIADWAESIATIHRQKAVSAKIDRNVRAHRTTAEAYERAAIGVSNNEHRSDT